MSQFRRLLTFLISIYFRLLPYYEFPTYRYYIDQKMVFKVLLHYIFFPIPYLSVVKIRPNVVEVEVNLYNMQLELRRVCREKNIAVVSVDPFGSRCRHQEK